MTEETKDQKKPQQTPDPLKDENAGKGGSYIVKPKSGTREKVKGK